jgi:hypothetical protein
MASFVDLLFGCWHKNYSFPISAKSGARRSQAAQLTGTYVVCLDCGKEFPYDWKEMRVLSPSAAKKWEAAPAMEPAEAFAASNGRAA